MQEKEQEESSLKLSQIANNNMSESSRLTNETKDEKKPPYTFAMNFSTGSSRPLSTPNTPSTTTNNSGSSLNVPIHNYYKTYPKAMRTGNIGLNIVINRKMVFGIRQSFLLLLGMCIFSIINWIFWPITNGSFYSSSTYFYNFIGLIIDEILLWACFLVEPGIIPRNHPDYAVSEEQKNKEEELNKDIPHIFQRRICTTCNILRPPASSHCRQCDNCVRGFDHHCFFISNCVGLRNHKFFYLFLLIGIIVALSVFILCGYEVYYMLFKTSPIISVIWKNTKFFTIVMIILIGLTLLFLCSGVYDPCIIATPAVIGTTIFIICFYKYIDTKGKPDYFNPWSILVWYGSIGFVLFIGGNLMTQTYNICQGYTVKQRESIRSDLVKRTKEGDQEAFADYTRSKTCKELFSNWINFIFARIEDSLIIPERDLVD